MMFCEKYALVLDVKTLDLLKVININTNIEVDDFFDRRQLIPFHFDHMVPDTGFKFMIECHD